MRNLTLLYKEHQQQDYFIRIEVEYGLFLEHQK